MARLGHCVREPGANTDAYTSSQNHERIRYRDSWFLLDHAKCYICATVVADDKIGTTTMRSIMATIGDLIKTGNL